MNIDREQVGSSVFMASAEQPSSVVFAPVAAASPFRRIDHLFFHSRHGTRWRLWDFLVALVSFWIAFALSPYTEKMPADYYMVTVGATYGLFLVLAGQYCGIPRPEQRGSTFYELIVTSFLAVALAYIALSGVYGLIKFKLYGRYIAMYTVAGTYFGILIPRLIVAKVLNLNPMNLILYGYGESGQTSRDAWGRSPLFRIVGTLAAGKSPGTDPGIRAPDLGALRDMSPADLQALKADAVVICCGEEISREDARHLLSLPLHGIEVVTVGAFMERYFRRVSVGCAGLLWFANSPVQPANSSVFVLKRLTDIAVALAGLALTLPFWPLIALLIRLDSPGPVFFRQRRVGMRGIPFTILKFRTMTVNAEPDGAVWAVPDDPRVTRPGRFLRMTRIDEIPQFLNVLRGEMSLVGPRPERPEFVEMLENEIPLYELRHLVPPGLTGWAQLRYRYGASKEDALQKLEYDLYYIRHISPALDAEILFKTIPLIMKGSR